MRYYKVQITGNANNALPDILAANQGRYSLFESHPNGVYNPGCPEISFDIINLMDNVKPFVFKLFNVPAELFTNANQFKGLNCSISAGYQAGLPLANPSQSGIIATGVIQNCIGNWIGTELVLDFLVYPGIDQGSPYLDQSPNLGLLTPTMFNFQWVPAPNNGTTSLQTALSNFFNPLGIAISGVIDPLFSDNPRYPIRINVTTFYQFCNKLQEQTRTYKNATGNPQNSKGITQQSWQSYWGVSMAYNPLNNSIILWDGTSAASERTIRFQLGEFVGQPSWQTAGGMVQTVTPLRSDVQMGVTVKFPDNIPNIVPGNLSIGGAFGNNRLTSAGQLLFVTGVRHVGKYRDPSATAWCTYIDSGPALRFDQNAGKKDPNAIGRG